VVGLAVVLFFFQAEDGIRDFHVTGVQTCALPISTCPMGEVVVPRPVSRKGTFHQWFRWTLAASRILPMTWANRWRVSLVSRHSRSEERRVGKECRGRRPPDQETVARSARMGRTRM